MVKTVMSSMTMAMVAADDATSLLQLSAGVRQSQGERILAAVAQGTDTICVQAAAGDVAPVTGSFTTRMSQQAVVVAAGSVAGEAGSFCVAKQDVLLIQRTFGLNTARDFEAALGSKSNQATTTTTTIDYEEFDFAGNVSKQVTVMAGECPGLLQSVEASVSDKRAPMIKVNNDDLRVCGCRNFLKSTTVNAQTGLSVGELERLLSELGATAAQAVAAEPKAAVLLQRTFDTALASKNTPTTTTTTIDHARTPEFAPLVEACTLASAFPGSWTMVAREVNNPKYVALFNSFNITGGWEHCDKSWVVQGACDGFVTVAPTAPVTVAP